MSDWAELDAWKKRLDAMHMRDRIPRKKYEGEVYHWREGQLMNEDKKPMTTPNYYRPGERLDKLVPFLCPTCGGINDARQYTLLRITYGPTPIMPCKKCECSPEPTSKHNGRLDEHDANISVYLRKHMNEVVIFGVEGRVALTPIQALSLLVWLEQERDAIYQLAKEQERE